MIPKISIVEDAAEIHIHTWNSFTLAVLREYTKSKSTAADIKDSTHSVVGQTIFDDSKRLAKTYEYGNTPIYKPILDLILQNVPDEFTKNDVYTAILLAYKKCNRTIKESTASTYGSTYCKYILDNDLVTEIAPELYRKKEDLDNWTAEEETALRNYYFTCDFPTIQEMLPTKTKDAILKKAKFMGLILRDK